MPEMLGCTKHPSVGTHGVRQSWATADEIGRSSMLQRAQAAQAQMHVVYMVADKQPHLTYPYPNEHSCLAELGRHTASHPKF